MNVKIGYYQILDLLLGLREIYMRERFKPFCQSLINLEKKLSTEDFKQIIKIGEDTNGYLEAISNGISLTMNGFVSPEEIFLQVFNDPKLVLGEKSSREDISYLIKLWQNNINQEISKYTKQLTNTTFEINEEITRKGVFNYLSSITDRFTIESNTIDFHIKPDFKVDIDSIKNIIIMPSVYGCRNCTFWYKDNSYLFYIGLQSKPLTPDNPSDMLLLKTSAFNDKTRLKILKLLYDKSYSVNEIAEILGVNASTASRHIKVFKDTLLVDIQAQEGNSIYYMLNDNKVKESLSSIYEFISGKELLND